MKEEKEEDKLSYMKKKMTFIIQRINMHEKMKKSEKAAKITEMIKRMISS